ncbi:MAG: ABC transporter permease [Thermaerobacter sp.]|nr:ABC transporter permease [Thermaerobacter sp.]
MTSLLVAEWRRMIIDLVRYPLETMSMMVVMLAVFAGMFFGAHYLTAAPIGGTTLSGVVIGYAVWSLVMNATGFMGYSIQNETQNGTLEQVMLAPWRTVQIFLVRGVMDILEMLIPVLLVLVGLVALTGAQFNWRPMALLPVIMIIVTAWGIGLMMAALALLFKRMTQMQLMIQFALLFIIMAPITALHGVTGAALGVLAPLTVQVGVLHAAVGVTVPSVSAGMWWEAVADMALWFGVGYWLLTSADGLARRRGIVGHY